MTLASVCSSRTLFPFLEDRKIRASMVEVRLWPVSRHIGQESKCYTMFVTCRCSSCDTFKTYILNCNESHLVLKVLKLCRFQPETKWLFPSSVDFLFEIVVIWILPSRIFELQIPPSCSSRNQVTGFNGCEVRLQETTVNAIKNGPTWTHLAEKRLFSVTFSLISTAPWHMYPPQPISHRYQIPSSLTPTAIWSYRGAVVCLSPLPIMPLASIR